MSDKPLTKVSIDTPPLTVTVEADTDLDAVAAKALALYREVYEPAMAKPGAAVGFTAERSPEEQ